MTLKNGRPPSSARRTFLSRVAVVIPICFASFTALYAYDWQAGPGYRRAPLHAVGAGKDGFSLLSSEDTRVRFTNSISEERLLPSRILPNGSGVAAGDVDGDGW